MNVNNKKYFSIQITKRFIQAMDSIIGRVGADKVTANSFGETVGISSSNLIRLRSSKGDHSVTIEAIGRLCHHYDISAYWLITGIGDMKNNDEVSSAYKLFSWKLNEVRDSIITMEASLKVMNGTQFSAQTKNSNKVLK